MGDFELRTVRGYDFYVCASIIQKAIRRGDAIYAGYFAHELVMSGYGKYVWKRLLTISAEDCYSAVTHEIKALYDACEVAGGVKVDQSTGKAKGRVFISKAILLLCECAKSRDADYLHCLVYDKKMLFDDSYAEKLIADVDEQDRLEQPRYALDVHTRQGRMMGKTKRDFFNEEHEALNNRQLSLFDALFPITQKL